MACLVDSLEISKELDQQNKMLENVNADFEEAIGGLDAVTKKTQELIKKSGEGHAAFLQQWKLLNDVWMARNRNCKLTVRRVSRRRLGYGDRVWRECVL